MPAAAISRRVPLHSELSHRDGPQRPPDDLHPRLLPGLEKRLDLAHQRLEPERLREVGLRSGVERLERFAVVVLAAEHREGQLPVR